MTRTAATILRNTRAKAGLSQAELARRANVTQPVISAYESGKREPALSTLQRLVEASGYRLDIEIAPGAAERRLPDTTLGRRLRRHRRAIVNAAEERGARRVRVFGSAARGDDTPTSDVDLLVDLDDHVSLVSLIALERELAEIIGRPVDVVPARALKPNVAERVLSEAIQL
jgi:hypothetical protein